MGLVPPPAYGRGALVGIVAARAATTGSSTPRPRCDPRSRKGVATVRLGEHLGDDAGGVVHDAGDQPLVARRRAGDGGGAFGVGAGQDVRRGARGGGGVVDGAAGRSPRREASPPTTRRSSLKRTPASRLSPGPIPALTRTLVPADGATRPTPLVVTPPSPSRPHHRKIIRVTRLAPEGAVAPGRAGQCRGPSIGQPRCRPSIGLREGGLGRRASAVLRPAPAAANRRVAGTMSDTTQPRRGPRHRKRR